MSSMYERHAERGKNTGGSEFGKKSYTRKPKPETPVLSVTAPDNLGEGEVWHPTHRLGKLLKGKDGQPLRDDEGRYLAEFDGPPKLRTRIPESLLGSTYKIGSTESDKK